MQLGSVAEKNTLEIAKYLLLIWNVHTNNSLNVFLSRYK